MAASQEIAQINEIEKGLSKLNSTLNQTVNNYLTLVKTISSGNDEIKNSQLSFDNLSKAQAQTKKTSTELDSLGKQLEATEKKLKETGDARYQAILKNRIEIQNATKAVKDKIKAEQAEEGSLIRMRQRLRELTAAYDATGKRTKEAAKEINDLSRAIGRAEAATNRHQRGVGGYADQLGQLPGFAGRAATSIQGVVEKLTAFGPVGALIGGGLLAISAPLVAFFTKSEKGVEMLERKVSGFKAAWSVLVGEMISGGEKMANALDKPEQKIGSFWRTILTSLNPAFVELGTRMDLASFAAENYTRKLQEMEDQERALIVPRAEANRNIKAAMLLYNDETKSIDVRMNALSEAIRLENETADAEINHQKAVVENIKIVNKEKQAAGQLRDEDDKKLQEAMARQIELETESLGRQMRASQRLKAARQEILKQQEEIAKKQKEIIEKNEKLRAESIIKDIETEEKKIEVLINTNEYFEDIYQERIDIALEADQKEFDNWYDLQKKKKEEQQKFNEKQKELEKELLQSRVELVSQGIDTIFSINESANNKELEQLETKKQQLLSNEQLTNDQRAKIEADFALKQQEIQRKQKVANKLQSAVDVGIKTAKSIFEIKAAAAVLLSNPLTAALAPLALAQIPFVLGSAGFALAAIAAYKDGTNNAKSEFIAGEAGRELMLLRSGEVMMANQPTYFKGSKFQGAKIISNPETEQMIKMAGENGMNGKSISDERLLRKLDSVERAIKNKPVAIFDSENKQIGFKASNHQTIYLNRLMRKN